MLLDVSSLLQTAASAWVDDDVASAVAELLYRSLELAPDPADELFTWMATVISSMHAHHPAAACGVVEQLAMRWGVDAAAAAAAGGQPCAAAAALQSLVNVLHGTVSATGQGPANDATVAALAAAEQCLCMCSTLIDPSYYQQLLVACASACSAAEVASLGGGLRFLGGLQQHADQAAGALAGSSPLGQALGAVAAPLGQALAHQLQGHCDDALVGQVARTLCWLLSTECVHTACWLIVPI